MLWLGSEVRSEEQEFWSCPCHLLACELDWSLIFSGVSFCSRELRRLDYIVPKIYLALWIYYFFSISRVSIKESSVAKLGSVCRRIYRIFSHAYFYHWQIFDDYENEIFLYHQFTKFVMKYNLMSKDNLIVPILEVQNSGSGESEAWRESYRKKRTDRIININYVLYIYHFRHINHVSIL